VEPAALEGLAKLARPEEMAVRVNAEAGVVAKAAVVEAAAVVPAGLLWASR
jgi:hypothetical protein